FVLIVLYYRYTTGGLAFFLNFFFLFLIIFKSPPSLTPYKIFLANSAITDLVFSMSTTFLQCRLIPNKWAFAYISLGPARFFGEQVSYYSYVPAAPLTILFVFVFSVILRVPLLDSRSTDANDEADHAVAAVCLAPATRAIDLLCQFSVGFECDQRVFERKQTAVQPHGICDNWQPYAVAAPHSDHSRFDRPSNVPHLRGSNLLPSKSASIPGQEGLGFGSNHPSLPPSLLRLPSHHRIPAVPSRVHRVHDRRIPCVHALLLHASRLAMRLHLLHPALLHVDHAAAQQDVAYSAARRINERGRPK
ncbi:hypothetical protein PFISCL1PPCAC_29166, partial [Pristionchus fissidentatus]